MAYTGQPADCGGPTFASFIAIAFTGSSVAGLLDASENSSMEWDMTKEPGTIVVRTLRELEGRHSSSDHTTLVIEESVSFLIAVASRFLDRSLNVRLQPYDVSFGQWPFLMALWAEEGISQRELSRRLSKEEATTTRTLGRMEAEGLISRGSDPGDKRQRKISLTRKGRMLRDKLVPEALDVTAVAVAALSEKEVAALRTALKKIIGSLKDNLSQDAQD
ncbi:MarR family transcriptional regulator [Roseiarcaceae bacterium H3SJ34-1]|uniref:MarR family winged helix-turn-helix transcriptional regulator n=1 Tax=Terripilifer ovatus TaxID=3032367 RepID=UPI003AB9455C|nr:MarR family transcriptional regulator [Roseiarcaceae bacterium H3SJ34-1]